jgi:hypothetical protein
MADPTAHDLVEEMVKQPTLDQFFNRNPAEITDAELAQFVEIERQRRVDFITADASK